ncbi:MAG TPA: hypothetical protein VH559_13385, partial [Gemmatimonadaceae bacterium]
MSADRTTSDPLVTPLAPDATPITDPDEFLTRSSEELDAIFRASPSGPIPVGQGEGTAIVAPGTVVSDTIASFIHLFTWKGKVFEQDSERPGHG